MPDDLLLRGGIMLVCCLGLRRRRAAGLLPARDRFAEKM